MDDPVDETPEVRIPVTQWQTLQRLLELGKAKLAQGDTVAGMDSIHGLGVGRRPGELCFEFKPPLPAVIREDQARRGQASRTSTGVAAVTILVARISLEGLDLVVVDRALGRERTWSAPVTAVIAVEQAL